MRKFVAMLLIAALAVCTACAEAQWWDDPVRAFGFEAQMDGFFQRDACSVRAEYALTLDENASGVSEAVQEAYAGYAEVRLIEFGHCEVPPIVQSSFVCVGVQADGTMEILPTPFDLIARAYSAEVLEGLEIEAC